MPQIADMPFIRILLAVETALNAVDLQDLSGVSAPVTVRHSRNRKVVLSERPSITILFVSDDPRPDDLNRNTAEAVRELVFDLQADLELATEDSGADPTGMALLARLLGAAMSSLKTPGYEIFLGGLVDWISAGGVDPSERSTPTDGRMTCAMNVVYRVRSDDPTVLLSSTED